MIIADRIERLAESQSLQMAARCQQMREQGVDVIGMSLGEPDMDTPQHIQQAAQEAVANHWSHYGPVRGLPGLREAAAMRQNERSKIVYTANDVLVSVGAKMAIYNAIQTIINPGDEVILPTPCWVSYSEMVKVAEGRVVNIATRMEDQYCLTPDQLRKAITPKTRLLLLCTPNNPTGTILNSESLEEVHQAALKNDIFVICDDVYRQLIYTDTYHSFTEFTDVRDRTILVQSFSKPYAMTGWRMGYLIADAQIKERLELIHQFSVVSTPAPFQKAAITALDFDPVELKETYARRRAYMLKRLKDMGLDVPEPQGAFYMFPSIARFGMDSATFCKRMISEAGLAATPGFCFGSDDHIRLTYCYSDDQLKEGLDRLEKFIGMLHISDRG